MYYAKRMIKALNYLIDQRTHTYPIDYLKVLNNAINYANYSDLTGITKTNLYFSGDELKFKKYDAKNILKQSKSVLDFLKQYDNNNGYLFVEIKKNRDIRYSILSGLEDTKEIKSITPKEYLNLFYSEETLRDANERDVEVKEKVFKSIDFLNRIERVDALEILDDLKKKAMNDKKGE